jgi:hypothetical protein
LAVEQARELSYEDARAGLGKGDSQSLVLGEHFDKALDLGPLLDLEVDGLSSTDRTFRVLFVLEGERVDRVVADVLINEQILLARDLRG